MFLRGLEKPTPPLTSSWKSFVSESVLSVADNERIPYLDTDASIVAFPCNHALWQQWKNCKKVYPRSWKIRVFNEAQQDDNIKKQYETLFLLLRNPSLERG